MINFKKLSIFLVVIFLTACSTKSFVDELASTPLDTVYVDVSNSLTTDVVSGSAQVTGAMFGGFIGALIGAAIDSGLEGGRRQEANDRVADINKQLADYEFKRKFEENITQRIFDTKIINARSLSFEEPPQDLEALPVNYVSVQVGHYLSSDMMSLVVSMRLSRHKKVQKRIFSKGNTLYQYEFHLDNPGDTLEARLQQWKALASMQKILDEGMDTVIELATDNLTDKYPRDPDGEPVIYPRNGSTLAWNRGRIVSRTADRAIIMDTRNAIIASVPASSIKPDVDA